ncbi:MAG: HpcH/HpaI aldolase/citrate lyase family protein [Desulfococcaceae bacterium]
MKPRRSILSVPGHVEKMHEKARTGAADVVMLDLEDSVPVDDKVTARTRIVQSLLHLDWGDKILTFRINGLDTSFGYRDLMEVGEAAGHRIDAVVIPKVNGPADVHFADRMLRGIEMNRGGNWRVGIEASIETARGLERVGEIARASDRLVSLVFGVADYSASVGAKLVSLSGHGEGETEIYPGHRWHFPLSRMVMAAKSNGLLAIDAPFGNFRDPDGLEKAAAAACAIGCDGKWAIHPSQIDPINRVFSPSREDVDRAMRILEASEGGRSMGRGAVNVDGRMVDGATVRLARQLVAQARRLNLA